MTDERIEFESDVFSASGYTLVVDGAAQSHVDALDPTHLFFEYTRRVGHVLDAAAPAGEPLAVLHLGGGAMTMARYVEATRPGSRQLVVDVDADLVRTVLERLPLPTGAPVEVLVADAAAVVPALTERFDVVVVDLYRALSAPPFVDTREFMAACLARLGPDGPAGAGHGILVVNVADAAGGPRLAAQTRAIARAAPGIGMLVAGTPAVLAGEEEGNAIIVAAPGGIPAGVRDRLRAAGPFPVEVLEGSRLDFALWGAC